jgi:hypothetical protein
MLVQRTEQEPDFTASELAIFFASHGDPEHAASILRPGMSLRPEGINEYELGVLRGYALSRGIVLVEDGHGELIADEAACCVWCREVHSADDPHAACAGPVPLDEVDAEETGRMCQICFKAVVGPPFPFCCSGRARLVKKITGPGPFKACPQCHGQGAGCVACEGTGVSL